MSVLNGEKQRKLLNSLSFRVFEKYTAFIHRFSYRPQMGPNNFTAEKKTKRYLQTAN